MSFEIVLIRFIRWIFYFILALSGICTFLIIVFFFTALQKLPCVPEPLSRIIETPPTEIFAATGERIMVLGGREYIPLNRISPHLIRAILATEDHRFWEHHGVDKIRTLKALWITLFKAGKIQGASTITQQLAKNLFFSFERSYLRKFQELLVAIQIESQYNKKEILEVYLNQVPFGVGALGIERAARTFFGKPASDLSLAEAAFLAGLPKSPTHYNPYRHFDRAKQRQRVVLFRMAAVSYIDLTEADRVFQEDLKLIKREGSVHTSSYFVDKIVKDLEEQYGPDVVYHGGLKVSTTLDPHLQSLAEASLKKGLLELENKIGRKEFFTLNDGGPESRLQGALVAIETNTGAVKAIVGGRDYLETEYNRAIQNNRLPGSGFKPFLYYAAFENLDLSPASVFIDQPIIIPVSGAPDWAPKNFEREFEGAMVLKKAFMYSVNTIAAQLVKLVEPEKVIQIAKRCGIESLLKPVYSIALGTSGVSPLEMASAYATFANGGQLYDPFWIRRVEDAQGRVLEENIVSAKRVLDKRITFQIVDMMRGVIDGGTGDVIRRQGFKLPAAGKTGTSDGYYDAWFTGFTPTLSVAVWVGFDRAKSLKDTNGVGITGGRGAAPIWADFMIKATDGEPWREFEIPDDVRFETIDSVTGCQTATGLEFNLMKVVLRKDQKVCENTLSQYDNTINRGVGKFVYPFGAR